MTEDPRLSVVALVHAYAERIDAGDFEGVADLLAEAELSFEGHERVCRGREEILALYSSTTRRYEDRTPRTKHIITNVVAELDPAGRTATSRSYFTVLQAVPGVLALQPIVAGRYRHRFARRDRGWVIAGMHISVDLVGELGHHLLGVV